MQIAKAYSLIGSYEHLSFFKNNFYSVGAYKKAGFLYLNSQLLIKIGRTDELVKGYSLFQKTLLESNSSWIKSSAANSLKDFYNSAKEDVGSQEKLNGENPTETNSNQLEDYQMRLDAISATINQVIVKEKSELVIERLSDLNLD